MTFDCSQPFERSQLYIKEELAKGQYGCIYDATYKNHTVVVKSALQKDHNEMLVREHKFLKNLQASNVAGIPKVSFSFKNEGKECFVMEKLGPQNFCERHTRRQVVFRSCTEGSFASFKYIEVDSRSWCYSQ